MTEAQWLTSDDPAAMLAYLDPNNARVVKRGTPGPRASDRKLRLFAVACCRAAWRDVDHDLAWRAIEAAEQAADVIGYGGLGYACGQAGQAEGRWMHPREGCNNGLNAAEWCASYDPREAAGGVLRYLQAGRDAQAALLREIVGNPFRPVVLPKGEPCRKCKGKGTRPAGAGGAVERPDRVRCKACGGRGFGPPPYVTPQVLSLARAAYENRLPDGTLDNFRLGMLADALEEAGCVGEECRRCKGKGWYRWRTPDDVGFGRSTIDVDCDDCGKAGRMPSVLLAHLRSPGPHVRGCWGLDSALGRQ